MDSTSTTAPAVEAAYENETGKPSGQTPPVQKEISSPSDKLRSFTDTALKFLSNASNETLGACAFGLCASTYLVLGRVGLVLIGAAAGVVIHATWESSSDDGNGTQSGARKSTTRRKELGIEVAKRVLDWKDSIKGSEVGAENEDVKVEASLATRPLDYSELKPATGAALTALTDAIIRDYVKYTRIKLFRVVRLY